MIIHTIIPPELLFMAEQPQASELQLPGGPLLQGVQSADGFTVSRIISTNPGDFLNTRYCPGSVIKHSGRD